MKTSAVLTVAIFSAAPALAGVLPIADAYADSGLVARWDAIDNAGTGVHDPNASTWKDLVGGNDLTIVPDVGSAWTNGTAFYMNTIENAKCPAYGKSAASDYKTIEIVYKKAPSNGRILFCGGVATRYVVFDYTDTEAPFVNAQVYFDGAKDTRHTVVGDLEPTSLAAVYDDSGAVVDIYRDGAESDAGSKPANAWSVDGNSQQVRLGCRSINPDSANRQGWEGEVYTVRLYDRVLTAAEISRNYAIDRARFFGEVFATNVIVATAVEGLEGAEPSGVYAIDAEGHTFSAPKKATLDGSVYVCTGYTLETWDGSGWGAPVKFQSASYAATDVAAKVRLTWQWQFVQAEESADLDPLADGYAKSGLVMHFDGIRNAGADKPHDWTAAQWVDLAGGKRADFFHDGEDSSGWTADG